MRMAFKPEESQIVVDSDLLSVFKRSEDKNEIEQGMSPKVIAEIVSDHLITVVRKQFNEPTEQQQK